MYQDQLKISPDNYVLLAPPASLQEVYRQYADIIMANLYNIEKSAEFVGWKPF